MEKFQPIFTNILLVNVATILVTLIAVSIFKEKPLFVTDI